MNVWNDTYWHVIIHTHTDGYVYFCGAHRSVLCVLYKVTKNAQSRSTKEYVLCWVLWNVRLYEWYNYKCIVNDIKRKF